MQADALTIDLKTDGNKLSVWHIDDDESNLEEVMTALAARRDHISNFDYALFDQQVLSEINVKMEYTKGDSSNDQANDAWHRDLPELSAEKLVKLAEIIMQRAKRKRFPKSRVLELVSHGVNSGWIDRARVGLHVVEEIDKESQKR